MKTQLVKLYNDELSELRKRGGAFADAHPKIASRLKLGQGNVEDPMVGRMLESFAFLTARVRHDLEHETELLSENLVQLLYPHYFLPIPACSTVEFSPSRQLEEDYELPRNTIISTPLTNTDYCYFNTRYPVTVKPIAIEKLHYRKEGAFASKHYSPKTLKSCFSFNLRSLKPDRSLDDLGLDAIRFFINAAPEARGQLHELFLSRTREIVLSYGDAHETISIPSDIIKPVGFADNENLLPYPDNSFSGYRLLTEYFAYPEKFSYFSLNGLEKYLDEDMEGDITLTFYFDQHHADLESQITDSTLQLHCTPVVNVFEQSAEPIRFDNQQREYPIVANAQYDQKHLEVYSVESVNISSSRYKNEIDSAPYFGRRFTQTKDKYLYWHVNRKSCESLGEHNTKGDEAYISFSDFNLDGVEEQLLLTPKVLCTNRDAADHLPYGGGKPELSFRDGAHDLIGRLRCVTPITTTKYRHTREHHRTELAEHICINQVGYGDSLQSCKTIKQLLSLYSFAELYSDEMIEQGVVSVEVTPQTIRHPSRLRQGFCRGSLYKMTIDEHYFSDAMLYLFGSVLHEFLTKSCSLNSFVELAIESKQRGRIATWQPKLGTKPIL